MAGKEKAGTAKRVKAGAAAKKKPGGAKTGTKKAAPRKPSGPKKASKDGSAASSGLDKSIEHFRQSLERSVTLSRDRLKEVVDDAVKRGRITRGDAEKLLSDLLSRGRKQTDSLLKELERLISQARREVGGRAEPVRKQATQAARRRARRKLELVAQQLEVEIDSLAFGGRGVARADGYVVFVAGALPGDRVRAEVTKSKRSFAEATRGRAA